jgi:hypothetical protein
MGSSKKKTYLNPHRRLVTGINSEGKSILVSDGTVPENAGWYQPGRSLGSDLWVIDKIPFDLFVQKE